MHGQLAVEQPAALTVGCNEGTLGVAVSNDAAATMVSERLIALVGKNHQQQGIAGNSNDSIPWIWYECLQSRK
jgi:hypothetical protein